MITVAAHYVLGWFWLESILLGAFSKVKSKVLQHPMEKYTSEYIKLSQLEGIQTRIPYSIKMK